MLNEVHSYSIYLPFIATGLQQKLIITSMHANSYDLHVAIYICTEEVAMAAARNHELWLAIIILVVGTCLVSCGSFRLGHSYYVIFFVIAITFYVNDNRTKKKLARVVRARA